MDTKVANKKSSLFSIPHFFNFIKRVYIIYGYFNAI